MAVLIVKKKGEVVNQIPLESGREYVAGRKLDCDIPLDGDKGISREHFKIIFLDGVWQLSGLSKLENLVSSGQIITILELKHESEFSLEDYSFRFEDSYDSVPLETAATSNDRTIVHRIELAAYIRITNEDGDTLQKIKLEGGDTWVAGRDSIANIVIADHRVSRKQFEIRKTVLGFEIVDLGSVNGTYINDKLLESQESVPLKSGDGIRILNHNLVFEVHDPRFFEKIEKLPPVPMDEVSHEEPMQKPLHFEQPQFVPDDLLSPPPIDTKAERTKKIRIAIGILAAFGVIFYLFQGPKPQDSGGPSHEASVGSDPLGKLTSQQKSEYRQSLELAKRYYMEGNYTLALSESEELIRVYQISDPELEKLKNTAFAAIETQKQLIKQEKEERDRQVMEAKIKAVVDECSRQLPKFNKEEELEACLVEALQLNPEHSSIVELRAKGQAQTSEREAKQAQRAEYFRKVGALKTLFESAQKAEKTESYLIMLEKYQRVIDSSLPDPNGHKSSATRRVKELKKEMAKKIKEYEITAEEKRQKQLLKEAVMTLREAVKIDPTRNDLKELADNLKNELRKQMMIYYQEGILDEGLGNVESGENRQGAKEKWKKILDMDLPDGEYYKKAYIKMKKYGAQ